MDNIEGYYGPGDSRNEYARILSPVENLETGAIEEAYVYCYVPDDLGTPDNRRWSWLLAAGGPLWRKINKKDGPQYLQRKKFPIRVKLDGEPFCVGLKQVGPYTGC